jgi:flagellar FliL protein
MAAASSPTGAAGSGPSFGQFIMAMLVVTVLAGALGAVFALHSAPTSQDEGSKTTGASEKTGEVALTSTSNLFDLPPIVTNFGAPQEIWVRLEASMIYDSKAVKQPESLAAEIANDLLAYLRTVSLAQIEGPIGLQNLRQDLNERASIRSGGAVKELVIRTLVLQ